MPRSKPKTGTIPLAVPALHHGQILVKQQARKKNFICAGRGWRKSALAMRLAIESASQGIPVGWGAFTMKPIVDVQKEQFRIVFGDEKWYEYYNHSDHILSVPGWANIYFRSLEEPENFRGPSYGRIICDEMGQLESGVYASVLSRIVFKSQGDFWGFGTPNPQNPFNDFWELLHMDMERYEDIANFIMPVVGARVEDDELIRVPNIYENPAYTWEMLQKDWDETPFSQRKRWRIEMLCEFISDEGSQFENIKDCCVLPYVERGKNVFWLEGYEPDPRGWFQVGVDVGIENDYTVISVLDRNSMNQVYMHRFLPSANSSIGKFEQVYQAIAQACLQYPGRAYVDCTGIGLGVPEMMRSRGISIEGINFGGGSGKKVSMMDNLADLIGDRRIKLFRHERIMTELQATERTARGDGYRIEARQGEHDDIPFAIAVSCFNVRSIKQIEACAWNFPSLKSGTSQYATMPVW